MKIIEKIALALFSTLILVEAVVLCLMIFGWLDIHFVGNMVRVLLNNENLSNITLGLCVVFILLAIRCIFFDSSKKKKEENQNGILLENTDGKLFITRETIENLVNGVVKGFDAAENATTRIELDKDNNLKVYVNLNIKENAVIKELSTNIQTRIKETIRKASDLEVKEVNIKVRNVEPVKQESI